MADDTIPTRDPRTSVMLSAYVFRANVKTSSQHRVVNISQSGICITPAEGIVTESAVSVSVGEIEHAAADVVWVRGALAGLRFRTAIDLPAARRRRVGSVTPPAAGWMAELNDPYRK